MNLKTGPGQKSRRDRDWEFRTDRFAICRNINKQPDCKSGWTIKGLQIRLNDKGIVNPVGR